MYFKGYMFLKDSSGTITTQAFPENWEVKCYPEAEEMLNHLKSQYKNVTGFLYTLMDDKKEKKEEEENG